jgi:hypothetical protein
MTQVPPLTPKGAPRLCAKLGRERVRGCVGQVEQNEGSGGYG